MTFQDLFKQIQDLLDQLKPERFTHFFFKKQTLLFGFTELADPHNNRSLWTKIKTCEVVFFFVLKHCPIKNILTNSIFLLFLEMKKEFFFCLFQDYQGPQPKFQDTPGFLMTVATLTLALTQSSGQKCSVNLKAMICQQRNSI